MIQITTNKEREARCHLFFQNSRYSTSCINLTSKSGLSKIEFATHGGHSLSTTSLSHQVEFDTKINLFINTLIIAGLYRSHALELYSCNIITSSIFTNQ